MESLLGNQSTIRSEMGMYKACGLEIAVYETFERVKNQLPVIQSIKKYFVINENWMMILNKQQSRSDDNETPLLPLKEL